MQRRTFVKQSTLAAFSIAAFGNIHWNGTEYYGDSITTTDILGPFYRPGGPMRSNLIPQGATAPTMHLTGTIYQTDRKTPLADVLIESWQCDENEIYDNISDAYILRGSVKTGKDGKYAFKTIVPVPYKDGSGWRPAHIHLRISSKSHQDLITQIYFAGDPHIAKDSAAASPQSINRILSIKKNVAGEQSINFDVVMGKTFKIDDAGYKKIIGLYKTKTGMAEFMRQDDLLMLKINGQYMEGFTYKGQNTFESAMAFNKAVFSIFPNGDVTTKITLWENWPAGSPAGKTYEGIKTFQYND